MTISQDLFKRAQDSIPGGVNSPVRAFNGVGGTPLFITKAEGVHTYDADGKDFSPRRGRIPNARWVEWYSLLDSTDTPTFKSVDEITAIMAEQGISKDDDVIIYCFKGSRASNTFAAMKMAGFTKLRNYLGSWYEWSADESLPIETVEMAEAQ